MTLHESAPIYSRGYVRYVVFLLTLVNVFNYADRMAFSVLLPKIKADLLLSDGQLGVLTGFAFSLFYAFCGIPIARLADRGSRKKILTIALVTWSLMTALTAFARSFVQIFVLRAGVGLGEAGGLSPAQSVLCDYVPVSGRAGVFSIHSFGLIIGSFVGMASAGWLADNMGWRSAFLLIGLPGLILAPILRLTLREPRRLSPVMERSQRALPIRRSIAALWAVRTFRALLVYVVALGFFTIGLQSWWPTYYSRAYGLSLSFVGVHLGASLGVGQGLGILSGGLIATKASHGDVGRALRIGAVAISLAIVTVVGSLFASSVTISLFLVAATGFLFNLPSGPVLASLLSVSDRRVRTTAASVTTLFQSVIGFGLGPFLVGLVSQLLTPSYGIQGLRIGLLVPVCALPIMILSLLFAARTLVADLGRANTIETVQ